LLKQGRKRKQKGPIIIPSHPSQARLCVEDLERWKFEAVCDNDMIQVILRKIDGWCVFSD